MKPVMIGPRGVARIEAGHPWVYRSDVVEGPVAPGFAPVHDDRGRLFGFAIVNPVSEIVVRMVAGPGEEFTIDLLRRRIEDALAYRATLCVDGTALRLVHAEADRIPGLVLDLYDDVVVLQNGCAALEPHLETIAGWMVDLVGAEGVLGRLDGRTRALEGLDSCVRVLAGHVPTEVDVRVAGITVRVDPWHGQKTGTYLDQRENQTALAARVGTGEGVRVLDVFSYDGGFGLHLARAGADVECVDSSASALARANENARINGIAVTTTEANAFDHLRARERARDRVDVVILDPPPLARGRRDRDAALRAHRELNLRALRLLGPGGFLVTASCSHAIGIAEMEHVLAAAAADAGRGVRIVERAGAARDHPEIATIPETRYLTCVTAQVAWVQ